jgi:hypothetical protein
VPMVRHGLSSSVVKVGSGRGFVVEDDAGRRQVITAAHCLPWLPPPHPGSFKHERTYDKLIGLLASGAPDVSVECLFADPVADLAILGEPDGQVLYKEWEAFDSFIGEPEPLRIGGAQTTSGYMLTLAEPFTWIEVSLTTHPRSVSITERVESGMSGSPILDGEGRAIAVISSDLINPRLDASLPGWAVEAFRVPAS